VSEITDASKISKKEMSKRSRDMLAGFCRGLRNTISNGPTLILSKSQIEFLNKIEQAHKDAANSKLHFP